MKIVNSTKTIILFIFILFNTFCDAQDLPENGIYFDQNENKISKKEFLIIAQKNNLMIAKNDSLEKYRLLPKDRTERGKINNLEEIILKIEERTNSQIDRTKPLVAIFYPGKDPYNSSGTATRQSYKEWFTTLEKKIFKISKTKPIYLYRRNEGLEKFDGIIKWYKDPENIIEKTFFRFHYPCYSYVIVSPNGNYISFFGEFSKDMLWTHLKELKKQ
ncbi:hypothetical protein [Flavobacterium gilvum]|uniref:Uncharacterized protein n=1 Tax=Flavobacterium gilvum TaxID=1492737 RepID=A0AAC9N5E3_9FLAO|nr:hypothetical protein [Flavobacterium gilvum]AOW09611.1 hypothetical protein EM308_08895 [Flavobacterium gilvum]KFC58551.1 hypothetical protein FEM08_26820 [Flavobacterium gilvum]